MNQPLSLAKYPYVHGNPVNATDPTGLFIEQQPAVPIMTQILSSMRSFAPIVRAIGTIGGVALGSNIANQVNLDIIRPQIRLCNATGDENCEAGIPIVFYGQTYNGRPLENTTKHVKSAIGAGRPSVLSAWAARPGDHGTKQWYKKKRECNNPARRGYVQAAQRRGMTIQKEELTCDEYPFGSSEQGGLKNYNAGLVSLQLVPSLEAGVQGQLMDNNSLTSAGVVKGDAFLKWYGVVSIPELPSSFWRPRSIN